MPFPPRGLWSNRPGDRRSLFRGKCRNEALAVQAGSPFRGSAKHSRPWQGLVQQRVTNPGGTAGLSTPKHRRYGSAPPKNGPSLRKRAFRGGRSRDLSLQEGRPARGPWRRRLRASGPSCRVDRVRDLVSVEAHLVTQFGVTARDAARPHPTPFQRPTVTDSSFANRALTSRG